MTKVTLHRSALNPHYYTTIGDTYYRVEHLEDGRWLITQYDTPEDWVNDTDGQMVEFFRTLKDARVQLDCTLENYEEQQRVYAERVAARDLHEESERTPPVFAESDDDVNLGIYKMHSGRAYLMMPIASEHVNTDECEEMLQALSDSARYEKLSRGVDVHYIIATREVAEYRAKRGYEASQRIFEALGRN